MQVNIAPTSSSKIELKLSVLLLLPLHSINKEEVRGVSDFHQMHLDAWVMPVAGPKGMHRAVEAFKQDNIWPRCLQSARQQCCRKAGVPVMAFGINKYSTCTMQSIPHCSGNRMYSMAMASINLSMNGWM